MSSNPTIRMDLSLPALERLLGGDTELEMNCRNQIADNFVKKQLKEIIADKTFDATFVRWESYVNQQISEQLAELLGQEPKKLDRLANGGAPYRIRQALDQAVDTAIKEAVETKIDQWQRYLNKMVDDSVNKALSIEIEKRVQEGVAARLAAIAAGLSSSP